MTTLRLEHVEDPPDDFLVGQFGDAAFHRAFKAAKISNLKYGYCIVYRDEMRVSVVPYFIMELRLNSAMPNGLIKRLTSFLQFKIAIIDHPGRDFGMIDGETSAEVLDLVNSYLKKQVSLITYKSFSAPLPLRGFVKIRTFPNAVLPVTSDYWSRLRSATRKNLRRKLRLGRDVRIEELRHSSITPELAQQMHVLYCETERRSDVRFIQWPQSYFETMASLSTYLLAYHEDRLIGFLQLADSKAYMVSMCMGLDYTCSKHHGTYFLLVLRAVDIAIREGQKEISFGICSYYFKKRIGCRFDKLWIYYQHSNPLLHRILAIMKHCFEPRKSQLIGVV